jgi:uncharacterized protein involved in outer membrane biogenesis
MRRVIGILAAVILVLVAVFLLTTRVFFPPEKVRRFASEKAGEALGLGVSVEDAHVSLFPPGVAIEGLRIENQTAGDPPLLVLREATVAMRLLPLLARRIEISRVRGKGADAVLVIEKRGTPPGDASGRPGGGGGGKPSPFTLLLSSAEIEEGTIRVIDRASGAEVFFDTVTARASVRAGAKGGPVDVAGELRAPRARSKALAAAGYADGLGPVSARYDLEYRPLEGTARIDSLRVGIRALTAPLEGEIAGLPAAATGVLRISTREIQLADLLSLLPAARASEFSGSGPLSVEGEVRFGPNAPLTYRMLVALGGLDVRNSRYKGTIEDLRGKLEATEKGITIEGLTAVLEGKPIAVSGTVVDLANPVLDLSVQGEIDLAALAAAGLLPEKLRAGGRVELDIRASGPPKKKSELLLNGSIKIDGVEIGVEQPPVQVTRGKGSILLEGKVARIEDVRFDFNGSPSVLDGSVASPLFEPRVTFDLGTRRIDLNAFVPPPEEGAAGPKPGEAPIVLPPFPPVTASGRIRVDTLLTGPNLLTGAEAKVDLGKEGGTIDLRFARGLFGGVRVRGVGSVLRTEGGGLAGSLSADSAIAYRIPLSSIKGKIQVTPPAEIRLDQLTANVYRGSVSGDVSITLAGPAETVYRIRARAEKLEANDFLSNLTPARDVLFGSFDMESEWEGKGLTEEDLLRGLSARGKVNVKEGEVRNLEALERVVSLLGLREWSAVRFREMWSSFSVADGRLRMDDMKIASPDADWNVSGSVGFDGTLDYDISVLLSETVSRQYAERSSLAGLLADESGRIALDLKLAGTAKSPNLSIDASKTAARSGLKNAGDLLRNLGKDEKVKGAIDDLLGGAKSPIRDLLGGGKKKGSEAPDTTVDTASAR